MEGEIKNFIKVWVLVLLSLIYCYFIVSKIPKGKLRLLTLIPIFYLFTILPLNLHSFHIGGPTAFYISWLANFKLLLFSFDQGPLSSSSSSSNQSNSLLYFISIACLPIKIKQNPSSLQSKSLLNFVIKVLLLALVIKIYDYKQYVDPKIILVLYCCHLYLGIEITLAVSAALARILVDLEIEPQFNEPYLSTSLQDFWGRRWNLMVTSILRPVVYDPIRNISLYYTKKEWAPLPAIFLTFVVSGLMHELIYFYLTRVDPTWEVTWFFVLHGICTALELILKKKVLTGRWRLHRWISRLLTIGFVSLTGFWLFFPQILRNRVDEKAIREYDVLRNIFGAH